MEKEMAATSENREELARRRRLNYVTERLKEVRGEARRLQAELAALRGSSKAANKSKGPL
jgi:hypothetical protein